MSHSPPDAAHFSKYEVIFDEALKIYEKKTGKDLKSDPLLHTLEACKSPDETLSELRRQIPVFDQSENNDNRLTNWIDPMVTVLHIFAQTIGGAVGLGFNPGAVIFTGISSLLSIVMALRAVQPTITELFESIKRFFIRVKIYVELPPMEEMTEIIVDVMVHVLHILALLTKEIKQGNIKRFLKKLKGRSDIEDALRRFNKLTQEESRMAIAQGLKATDGVGNDVRGIGDGVKVAIDKVDAVLNRGENMRVELQQVVRGVSDLAKDASHEKRSQMRQDIENWLSPADPSINFNTANEAHYEGTAEWFVQGSVFKNWKESGSLLWIHGKPGSGKSVLSSTIIQDTNEICNAGTGHLAFFFFDFKDAAKQDVRALLSSIIVQLGDRSVGLFDVLLGFYSTHRDGKQQPSISALIQCLEDMLKVPEELPIYLIIDAIDECPNTTGFPSSRDKVMTLLERLVILKLPNLRICVTSRPEADIRTFLESLTSTSNSISLHDESGQREDIINFVTSMVRSDRNMGRWREADKELVINTLSEKAEGMFRWVFCQLEMLRPCLPSSVRGIVAELPDTLDATYERILQEIPKPNRVHAHRLLQCLAAAVRPLAVEELAEVLAIDFDVAGGIPKLNRDFRWADQEQAVLSACSSLIAIIKDEDSHQVQFSHFSVKEFLSSDRLATSEMAALRFHHIRRESAHTIMAQACLSVLLQLDDNMDKMTIEGYPLAKYAAEFFNDHAKAGGVLSQNNDGVDHLLDPDKPHFNPWLWLQCGDIDENDLDLHLDSSSEWDGSSSDKSSSDHPFPTYPPRISPLYYTLGLGHRYLTRHLILKRPHDLDTRDVYGRTPLHLAVYTLDFEATRMLLDRTADINARDNRGWTPLHYAVSQDDQVEDDQTLQDGRFCCVQLLLECGADAEAQNNRGATPLHLAASNVSPKIVQILIENVTNINMRNDQGQTALHKASRRGGATIINIILNHGADVGAQDKGGSTPLHLVISDVRARDAEQAVGVLLEHGANVNIRKNNGQTALHKASRRNYIGIMRLILNHGPDVNALDNNGSTPLHSAISEQAVGLLLEHGANTDLRNCRGQTALHKTSLLGYPNIIHLILNHGGNVDAQDNGGSTPLHLVISHAHPWNAKRAIGVLLEHRANINLRNHEGQTVLHKASRCGDIDIMHPILKHSPDVNALDNDGSTPLHLVISDADSQRVERAIGLLLEHGANINLQNDQGQTALHTVSLLGYSNIVALILNHGADVDAQDNDGSTPLHLIISNVSMDSKTSKAFIGSELLEVIKILLEHGASGQRQNNRGETPFQLAAVRGLQEITRLLSMYIQSE